MTITNEGNMELMARCPDNHFDLAIVDPPYGMRGNPFQMKSKNLLKDGCSSMKLDKDTSTIGFSLGSPPDQKYFDELIRVSKNQIVFGMQYFVEYLKSHQCVIFWDKENGDSRFSDGEIAWTSFESAVRIAKIHNPSHPRICATQKPVKLYEWILINYAKKHKPTKQHNKKGDCVKILDTHLGGGSIAIACHNLSFDLTACELDKEQFDRTMKRIEQHKDQARLNF